MGNISEFGANFKMDSGPPASLDFMSKGITIVRTAGGMTVNSLPSEGNLEAKLMFSFEKEKSCLIKATLQVKEMQNINQVARVLAQSDEWEPRFRVVSASYTGDQCVILVTREANTKVEFSGKVDLLKQVEQGKVEISPSITLSNERAFKSVGKTGVVGLRLFKLGRSGRPKFLGGEEEILIDEDWGDNLEDDL